MNPEVRRNLGPKQINFVWFHTVLYNTFPLSNRTVSWFVDKHGFVLLIVDIIIGLCFHFESNNGIDKMGKLFNVLSKLFTSHLP